MKNLNTNFEDFRVNGPIFDYGCILATMEVSKDYHIRKMHEEYGYYLDADVGEVHIESYAFHKQKADIYRRNINRYLANEFANKYSKFKSLGKKIDFSSAPPCEVDWDDLPF